MYTAYSTLLPKHTNADTRTRRADRGATGRPDLKGSQRGPSVGERKQDLSSHTHTSKNMDSHVWRHAGVDIRLRK